MNRNTLYVVVVLVVAGIVTPAHAQKWGTEGNASLGDIRSSGGQSNFTFDSDGGAGVSISGVLIDDALTLDGKGTGPWNRGETHAFTEVINGSNQPGVMRAEAFLTGNLSPHFEFGSFPAGAVASSGVFSSELFEYTGANPTTLSLTYTLDGLVDDPTGNSIANSLTGIFAEVAVFADTPNYDFFSDVGTLVFEVGATLKQAGGVDAHDNTSLRIDNDTGGLTEFRNATLMFDVVPGETFYVWQTLNAQAAFGTRAAEAFTSLTGTFDQPQFVTSLSGTAPLVGDLDGDGFVGINDLNIILGAWNQSVPPGDPDADPSGDGFVGLDDLNAVLGNWNAGTPPPPGAAVPEPASLTLLTLAGLTILQRRNG